MQVPVSMTKHTFEFEMSDLYNPASFAYQCRYDER